MLVLIEAWNEFGKEVTSCRPQAIGPPMGTRPCCWLHTGKRILDECGDVQNQWRSGRRFMPKLGIGRSPVGGIPTKEGNLVWACSFDTSPTALND